MSPFFLKFPKLPLKGTEQGFRFRYYSSMGFLMITKFVIIC